jgi:hypothetical protein
MLAPIAAAAPVDRPPDLGDDFDFEGEIDVDVADGSYERNSVSTHSQLALSLYANSH